MSKQPAKEAKPESVEIWTRNLHTYYSEVERLVLEGYTVILDDRREPTNIAGIMTATLKLKTSQ